MSFWNKIQDDLKKNFQEGLEIFKEGSSAVTEKLEQFTGEGKKKYKVFNLNMKVQEEFAKLGGEVYDLIAKKTKSPLTNPKVKSIIAGINKLESQIDKLETKAEKKTVKKTAKKTTRKAAKKTSTKKKVNRQTTSKKTGKTSKIPKADKS